MATTKKKETIEAPKGWILLSDGKGVRTGEVKLSYPRLFELDPTAEINKDKYTTSIVVTEEEKDFLIKVVIANCYRDAVANYNKWGGRKPDNFDIPEFKKLSDEDKELFYPGSDKTYYSVVAKTKNRPTLVDIQTNKLTDPEALYGGVIVRMTLTAYPWAFQRRTGVSFSIGVVQKLADAPRVGGSQANNLSLFEDTSDVDLSALGGDPFAMAQDDTPDFARGSDDSDLVMQLPTAGGF